MEPAEINSNAVSMSDQLDRQLREVFSANERATFNQGALEELYTEHRGYMRECIRVMFLHAIKNVQLQIIDLPNERLSEEGALVLRVLLQRFVRLSYLRLMDNALDTAGLRHLVEGFRTASQVEILDLSMNHLDDDSAAVLAEGLGLLPLLQSLRLNNNEFADRGAATLAPAFLNCHNLTKLDMSFNDIASRGATLLAQHFPQSLVEISLIANKISTEAVPSFKMCLRRLVNLRELNLGGNPFKSGDRRQLKSGRYVEVVHFGVSKSLCSLM